MQLFFLRFIHLLSSVTTSSSVLKYYGIDSMQDSLWTADVKQILHCVIFLFSYAMLWGSPCLSDEVCLSQAYESADRL